MDNSPAFKRPLVIGIGGLTSEVGKTTLLCQLLRAFPGWEAIKTTRGHYRSCGKDPEACCVSDLLGESPVVRSGHEQTYAAAKDTGRYWDAGAVNVHWVIATDKQVEAGIKEAVSRVRSKAVLIEGNSFTEFIQPDFFVMVVSSKNSKIKTTARKSLPRVSAYYVTGEVDIQGGQQISSLLQEKKSRSSNEIVPVFLQSELKKLVRSIGALSSSVAA